MVLIASLSGLIGLRHSIKIPIDLKIENAPFLLEMGELINFVFKILGKPIYNKPD